MTLSKPSNKSTGQKTLQSVAIPEQHSALPHHLYSVHMWVWQFVTWGS